ncbi:hypothetical protein [Halobacterium noricense]|uniref:hypothetical protein n=1 Tax=Halobacterium noricense TaxID=223182 RepID=UPI001E517E96|nr:hypothetical protein [Halobacterium noricense]UHH26178.1 hypothetical protein LT974_04400 [Halobacterium noricense]
MKSVLSGTAISLGGGSIISGDALAAQASDEYEEKDFAAENRDSHSYSAPDNIYATQYKTQIGGAFGYRQSSKNNVGNWVHRFGAALDAKHFVRDDGQSEWEQFEGIKEMEIELMETGDSGNNPSMNTPAGGFKVGASPNPEHNTSADYTDAVYTLAKSAIAAANPGANAAIIASDVLNSALSASSGTYDNTQVYTWTFNSNNTKQKANAHCLWNIEDPDSDTAKCNVSLRAYDGTNYNTWAQLTTDITVHSGDSDSGEIPDPSPWPTQQTINSEQEPKDPPVPDDHVIEKRHTEISRSEGMESPVTVPAADLSEQNTPAHIESDEEVTIMEFPIETRISAYAGYVE